MKTTLAFSKVTTEAEAFDNSMKRFWITTISLIFVWMLIPLTPAHATEEPTILIIASLPDSNGEFDAAVAVKNNIGLAFFSLQVSFDNTKLRLVSSSQGQLRGVTLPNATALANANEKGFATFTWVDANRFSGDISLFSMKFVKIDGASGIAPITLSIGSGGIFDADMNNVASIFTLDGTEVNLEKSGKGEGVTTEVPTSRYPFPVVDTIPEETIKTELKKDKPIVKIEESDSTIISKESLQNIKDSGKSIEIKLPSGVIVTIDPKNIADNAREVDINVKTVIVDEERMVDGIPVPNNSIVIYTVPLCQDTNF